MSIDIINKIKDEGKLYRSSIVKKESIDEEKRTVQIAFSSEEPYQRWFGLEVLGHKMEEVNMEFISSGSAPFLDSHNSGKQIGVIEKAWIDEDRKGRAIVRFSKNKAADEIYNDVVDGIRKNISVGYEVNSMTLISDREDEGKTYRVDGWTPLEASSVSIPADMTVGVGRGKEKVKIKKENTMTEEEKARIEAEEKARLAKIAEETRKAELNRIKEITALGNHRAGDFKKDAEEAINSGMSVEDFRAKVYDKIDKALEENPVVDHSPEIGLTKKDAKKYSFMRLIRAMVSNDWRGAEFERECSEAFEKASGRKAKGYFVPPDMMKAGNFLNEDLAREIMRRDLNTGTGSAGGYLVAENLLTSSFVDLLRNKMMVVAAGARILSDLEGDIDIPKQTGGSTGYWLGSEGDDATESQQTLGQIRMSPKTAAAFTDITRRMMLQSSISVEAFVREDFMNVIALLIDAAAINGSGANGQPRGILNVSGIGSVTLNAANTPDWGDVIDLKTAVRVDNALMGSLAYMTNATISGKMEQTEKASNTAQFILAGERLAGYPCLVTEQVPAKYMLFGNWNDLIIGYWSGLDVTVDTSTLSKSGGTRIVVFQDCDTAVRHAESFAKGYKA